MAQHLNQTRSLRIALGLIVAVGILGSRTEKLFVEVLGELPAAVHVSQGGKPMEPFDPARVPQSGGMASRLLAGITARLKV